MDSLIFDTPKAMQAHRATMQGRVGFVPTMGALHEGHISLVAKAKEHADTIVMSIFVNPTQFNEDTDYAKYPRQMERDLKLATAAGVDCFYAPTDAAMYPEGFGAYVVPEWPMTDLWEGAHRPGHFRGVTTVVLKLFNAVRPDIAVFGLKDFQQYAILNRMCFDLDLQIEMVGSPTHREADGVAMSSRNARLSIWERSLAQGLVRAMAKAERAILTDGRRDLDELAAEHSAALASSPDLNVEYLTFVDPVTLEEIEDPAARDFSEEGDGVQLLLAVRIGETRLIDNHLIKGAPSLDFA